MPRQTARKSILAIFAVFFCESVVLGNWITRIPDIKSKLNLTDTALGFCMLAIPMGTLLAFSVAGKVMAILGLRNGCRIWLPAWAIVFLLPGQVTTPTMLFVVLLLSGIAIGMCEVAMNTKADEIERVVSRRIMSRCHGFWSLGSMVGALLASAFAHWSIAVSSHYLIVMPIMAVLGYIAATALPEDEVDQHAPQGKTATFKLPSAGILLLCLMPVGIMTVEGAFIDWSAVFMKSVLDASPIVIGITYAFFSVVMAATRLSGDWLADKFGDLHIVRWSGIAATIGIGVFATSPNITVAFIGATLAGLGVAIVYPLAMSAAARRPGQAANNVAAMSLVGFTSFMVAPPLIGFISDVAGLRWALLLLVPVAAMTPLLANEITRTGSTSR